MSGHMDEQGRIELRAGPVPVIALIGEFDVGNVGQLCACLDRLRKSGTAQIAVDLSEATFIDSTTINAIVWAHNDGVSVSIAGASGSVLRTLEVAAVDTILPFE